jgi:hypothetical protein
VLGAQPAKNIVTSLNHQQAPKPTPLNPSTTPLKDSVSNQFHDATTTQQMVDSLDMLQFQLQSALSAHTIHKEQSEAEQLILLSRITALASQVEFLTSSKQNMSDLLHQRAASEATAISALKDMQEKCAQLEAQLNNALDENSALRLASEQQQITLDMLTKALSDAEATIEEMNKEKDDDDDDDDEKSKEEEERDTSTCAPISPAVNDTAGMVPTARTISPPPPPGITTTDRVQGLAVAAASRKEASLQLSSLKLQVAKMNNERSALHQTHQALQSQLHAAQATIADLSKQLFIFKSTSSPSSDASLSLFPSPPSALLDTRKDNNDDAGNKERGSFSIKAIHGGSPSTKITALAHQEEEEKEIEEEDKEGGGVDNNSMAFFLGNAGKLGKGAALTVGLALLFALLGKRGGGEGRRERGHLSWWRHSI